MKDSVSPLQAVSALQQERYSYQPRLPAALRSGSVRLEMGSPGEPAADQDAIRARFPQTYGQPLVHLAPGDSSASAASAAGEGRLPEGALRVGVVLSGGQAPGGHNVIAGLFDALRALHPDSRLFGFLQGPKGVIEGHSLELTADTIDRYRNTGGFDMIQSGRDKIETGEQLASCAAHLREMDLHGLVVIGGDDSNTNAAVLAEYLKDAGSPTAVIGVPKTIDGDMKNEYIEASFGFDTASRVYAELIGNICRDAASAVKYWHFIRLMGRAASHVTLECALQTHPNITLISEEVREKGQTLQQIVEQVADAVVQRAKAGRHYGVVLVPEGLVEFIGEIRTMIDDLSRLLGQEAAGLAKLTEHEDRVAFVTGRLADSSARVYASLPPDIQATLLRRDSHGNVPLSQVETERMLSDMVAQRLRERRSELPAEFSFSALHHFFGYEGRCAPPTNFDADYTYSLGYAAVQIIRAGLTGYTVTVRNLTAPDTEWVAGGVPITMMLNMEMRKGKDTPVIRKALVELKDAPFRCFASQRDRWALEDAYTYPGPIQYWGPPSVCSVPPLTLQLEKGSLP